MSSSSSDKALDVPGETFDTYPDAASGGETTILPMETRVRIITRFRGAFKPLSGEEKKTIMAQLSNHSSYNNFYHRLITCSDILETFVQCYGSDLSFSACSNILVAHTNSNIAITGKILRCLNPRRWLNDEIFVPISISMHWALVVINVRDMKFQYVDSLEGNNYSEHTDAVAKYFVDEVKDKSGVTIDVSQWTHEYVHARPVQTNVFDCGMYMLKYIDFYSRGMNLCFGQGHIPYFRLRTAKEILQLKAE